MSIAIQSTVISSGRVEMLIADAPTIEAAKTWVRFSVPLPHDRAQPVAKAQQAALRALRDIVGAEMRTISSLPSPNL